MEPRNRSQGASRARHTGHQRSKEETGPAQATEAAKRGWQQVIAARDENRRKKAGSPEDKGGRREGVNPEGEGGRGEGGRDESGRDESGRDEGGTRATAWGRQTRQEEVAGVQT